MQESTHLTDTVADQITDFTTLNPHGVVIIRGATATGKSSLSVDLARKLPVEIISADSRQVYRFMDIGTDKVSQEIRNSIPHHQIDIVDPKDTYTAGERHAQTGTLIPAIQNRNAIPIITGGTGLYIDTLYKNFSMPEVAPDHKRRAGQYQQEEEKPGYLYEQLMIVDPEEAQKHHPHSTRYLIRALEIFHKTGQKKSVLASENPVQRPLLMIGLRREKEETNRRINARIKEMIGGGLIEEVEGLFKAGYTLEHTAMNGIGYKEIVGYIHGEYGLDKAVELLKRNTHRYAKRQRSWFRRYIAEGKQTPKENVTYQLYTLQ